jgi:hypothetical protein
MSTSAKSIMDMVKAKKAAIQATSGRREQTHKPSPGKNRYRILPSWRGAEDATFFHDFGQHFVKDAAGQLKAVYVCVEKTFGRPCDVCEALAAASVSEAGEAVKDAIKESRSKGRVLVNALHLDGEDPTAPVILDLTPTTFEKVLSLFEEYGNITDLDEGSDIVITRTGKGLNTEYTVIAAAKSKPVPASVLKRLNDLDKYVMQEYDEGRLKAIAAVSSVSGLLPAPSAAHATGSPHDARRPVATEGEFEASIEPFDGDISEMSDDELDALLREAGPGV